MYWKIASFLIKKMDPKTGERFDAAFTKRTDRILVRHLSKRQLAACLIHLGIPQNDRGFIETDFLIRHLSKRERAAILTLPRTLRNIEADSAKKATDPDERDREAIKGAMDGDGNERSATTLPFAQDAFETWENRGQGNCLFHALYSEGEGHSLQRNDLLDIRHKTALIRFQTPDTQDKHLSRNWNEMTLSISAWRLNEAFEENGIPKELSNAQFAELQQRFGYTCGDLEVEQWLKIPGNNTESVVVIDGQQGRESIVTFTRDKHEVVRSVFDPRKVSDGNYSTRENIYAKIGESIKNAVQDISARRHVAIYRSPGHFVRIVKQCPLPEI